MKKKSVRKEEQNEQPGKQNEMDKAPKTIHDAYKGSEKLKDKVALITGGDSGIGRSVAVHFAREGADIAIVYLEEDQDAADTRSAIEDEGRECLLIMGDIKDEDFCKKVVERTIKQFGKLNVVVNNAAMQFPEESLKDISTENLRITFETNIFSFFYIAKAALEHLKKGDVIINTTS